MRAPINGDPPITQNYGDNPGGNNPPGGHNGRDYGVPIGTPVVAVTDGTILYEGWTEGNYQDNPWWFLPGDMVIVLAADDGTQFVYGHLNTTNTTAGNRVTEGQVIGTTGNTGKSTGPHLHFEALAPGYNLSNGMYGRTDPGPYIDGITLTTQSITEQDDMFTDADRELLKNTLNKGDGGQLRADTQWQNGILADIQTRLGATLNKDDGGYIVALLDAIKPGQTNADAIADTIIAAVGNDVANQVITRISQKLGTP